MAGSRLYVYMVSLVAATSGLLFGFDIAVINGALVFLREQFRLSEVQTEVAASSLLVGCIFGAAVAGTLSDRYGRRAVLILSAILFAVSSFGAALPRNLTEFIVARFIGGIAIGVASVLAPLYIAEVSPRRIRGRLVSLNQMAIVSGILLAYLVNWSLSFLGAGSWRWMFAAAAAPSIAFLIGLVFVPESPRFLVEIGKASDAMAVLTRVLGHNEAQREYEQIREAIAAESGTWSELFAPGVRKALALAVSLAILQQFVGINTVLFYGSIIFRDRLGSASESAAIGANVLIGLTNFLATIVALWIIDQAGRKALLMLSSGVMGISLVLLGLAFRIDPPPAALVLVLMFACVASFAVGLGPGVWVVIAEIFPTRVRGRGVSIATVSLWSACVALTLTFLSLAKAVTISGAFWIYAAMCFTTLTLVWRATPETKGRSLEEIEKLFK